MITFIEKLARFVGEASGFLHSATGKKYLTYGYPAIKEFTRKYWNLGIYERLEKGYKIIDDTFYGGEVDFADPQEVAEMERLAEQMDVESQDSLGMVVKGTSLPNLEDKMDQLLIWKSDEQGNTFRCDTFARNNMIRSAMLTAGLKPQHNEVMAYDPGYIMTKHGKGKTGTVVEHALDHGAKNGVPIPCWTNMQNHNNELVELENSPTIKNAYKFVFFPMTGKRHFTRSFEEAVELDRTLPKNWMMQVSVSFNGSLKYFGQKKPFLEKVNGQYQFTRTGGHSVHGVRGSFSKWNDGDEGFVIIDSAYRSREDGWRFLTKRFMDLGLVRIRFVEFNLDNLPANPNLEQPKVQKGIVTAKKGDNDSNVQEIQEALIKIGEIIPAGATGYYGSQTMKAVSDFQQRHARTFEDVNSYYKTTPAHIASGHGERFGNDSVKVINMLLSQ